MSAYEIRLSFEEELSEDVRKIDLDPVKRDLNLSTVDEEEEQQQQQMEHQAEQAGSLSQHEMLEVEHSLAGDNNRPPALRRATDPIAPTSSTHLRPLASSAMGRSRTRSPYSRSHLRSKSNTSYPMTRTYSSPLSDSTSDFQVLTPSQGHRSRPESPMGTSSYGRRASPRRHLDEPFIFNPVDVATPSVPTIEENVELSIASLASPTIPEDTVTALSSPFTLSSSFSQRLPRRRPSSPLHSSAPRAHSPGAHVLHTSSSVPSLYGSRFTHAGNNSSSSSNTNSVAHPSITPTSAIAGHSLTSPASKYNEAYPTSPITERAPSSAALSSASSMYSLSMGSSIYSGSSMPSTPTSMRSRSPSISSLDTIPDSPDAEEQAVEEEKAEKLERLERMEKLRSLVGNRDGEEIGRRMLGGGGGGSGRERKRWSVCGAERRGDLEMETIWED